MLEQIERKKMQSLSDYFVPLSGRQNQGVYFCRINGYSVEIEDFIKKYYDAARKTGVVIEGKIPNPDDKNLAYYAEIMGMEFQLTPEFITDGLKRWLPRMNDFQNRQVAASIYDALISMQRSGKTQNMLKNLYIKLLCWLYYKFECVINRLGADDVPKILYEGTVSQYELMLLSILSNAGCDIVLLQYEGDAQYLKLDRESRLSDALEEGEPGAFPEGFCLRMLREGMQEEANRQRLYGTRPSVSRCTNAWMEGNILADIRKSVLQRGADERFYYNLFCRMNGVEDKLTYVNELLLLQQELKGAKRRVVIVSGEIPKPTPDEINAVKRGNYAKPEDLILDLSGNITYAADVQLQRMLKQAFVDVMLAEEKKADGNLNRLTTRGVYLLCWLKRYQSRLFSGWRMPQIGCFLYMGGCKNGKEAMFMSFLGRLPVDVLILCPNLNTVCCLEDPLLYEVNYDESLSLSRYPEEDSQVQMGTAAYHAERELDTLMYQDSGMYRNQQYGRANVIVLQTMYEEIKILWDQELKYRPGFGTIDGVVNIPVLFAKVSGVKDGAAASYWASIRELITCDTLVVRHVPYIRSEAPNPMKPFAVGFLKNGRLLRDEIKNHPRYPYGILREEVQDMMLERLQGMLDQRLIKGIGENGMEYTVIAQILNLPGDIVRMLQRFDFTKKNPKLIYINTSEAILSLEDSILTVFLNLMGFDILFFVPTGYRSIEKYFQNSPMEEHQIGEYLYDLQVPDMRSFTLNGTRPSWRDKIFKRGN